VHWLDSYAGLFARLCRFDLHKDFHDGLRPVAAITQQTQVRQRLLRRARFTLHFGQLVTFTPRKRARTHTHTHTHIFNDKIKKQKKLCDWLYNCVTQAGCVTYCNWLSEDDCHYALSASAVRHFYGNVLLDCIQLQGQPVTTNFRQKYYDEQTKYHLCALDQNFYNWSSVEQI
jgi:hypothetical protein